jgi:aminotransferase
MTAKVETRMPPSKRSGALGVSGIRQIFERAQKIPGAIRLEFGEPDFDTPENIKQAAFRAIAQGKTKYTSSSGIPELRKAVSDKLSRENAVYYDHLKEIVIAAGATSALYLSFIATLDQSDEILVPNPGWATYVYAINLVGAKPVPYPLRESNGYAFPADEVEKLVTPRTRAILINSPSNPTGAVFSRKDMESIAEFAIKHNLFVISDEVYEKFLYSGGPTRNEHITIASLREMKERTVTVNSMSKTYAMTGWRIAYAAASPEIVDAMVKVNASSSSCVSSISQYAALEALTGPQNSVKKMISAYAERRDALVKGLNDIRGFQCQVPSGAFYAFPNIKGTSLSSYDLAMKILESAHVATVPGNAFGSEGEGYLRVSYSNSLENITHALSAIKRTLETN